MSAEPLAYILRSDLVLSIASLIIKICAVSLEGFTAGILITLGIKSQSLEKLMTLTLLNLLFPKYSSIDFSFSKENCSGTIMHNSFFCSESSFIYSIKRVDFPLPDIPVINFIIAFLSRYYKIGEWISIRP